MTEPQHKDHEHKFSTKLARGIGGKNDYVLSECLLCGFKTWELAGLKAWKERDKKNV